MFNIRADLFGGWTNRPVCAQVEVASRHFRDGRSHPALTKAGNVLLTVVMNRRRFRSESLMEGFHAVFFETAEIVPSFSALIKLVLCIQTKYDPNIHANANM